MVTAGHTERDGSLPSGLYIINHLHHQLRPQHSLIYLFKPSKIVKCKTAPTRTFHRKERQCHTVVTYEVGCISSNSSCSITRPVYSATGWFIRRFSAASIIYHTALRLWLIFKINRNVTLNLEQNFNAITMKINLVKYEENFICYWIKKQIWFWNVNFYSKISMISFETHCIS